VFNSTFGLEIIRKYWPELRMVQYLMKKSTLLGGLGSRFGKRAEKVGAPCVEMGWPACVQMNWASLHAGNRHGIMHAPQDVELFVDIYLFAHILGSYKLTIPLLLPLKLDLDFCIRLQLCVFSLSTPMMAVGTLKLPSRTPQAPQYDQDPW
jgi:hypothetical protein